MFMKVVITLSIIYFVSAYRVSYSEVQEDDIDSLFEKLQKSLDRAINESHTKIEDLETRLNDIVDDTGYILHYALGLEKQMFDEYLDRLIAAAAKKGVDIDDCLAYNTSIIYLPFLALNETMICTGPLISIANENLNGELNQVTNYADYIVLLKKEAEKCRKSTDSKSCLAKITSKINNINVKMWKTVDNIEESINDYGINVIKSVIECGKAAYNHYGFKLDDIKTKISDCIDIKT